MATEAAQHGSHKRRSSLTDALADMSVEADQESQEAHAESREAQTESKDVQVPTDMPHMPVSPWSNVPNFDEDPGQAHTDALPIPLRLGEPRKSGIPEATESPFTPEDSPVYELCPESPIGKRISPLKSVPEETATTSLEGADIVQPESLQLPILRTPRKGPITEPAFPAVGPAPKAAGIDKSDEERLSVDFSAYRSGDLDAFNPFASTGAPGGMAENNEEEQEEEGQPNSLPLADMQEIPQGVAHLDFGSKNGGGVVGPKLGRTASRQADKFEVHEGEDAEIKQLLWVIENLQEELHISNRSFGQAEQEAQERQAVVDRLEDELSSVRAQEAELSEKLNVIHSQLEAQLLTNLEQEEEIRMSGEKLKTTKSEIVALDEQLAEADARRRRLEAEAVTKRAKNKSDSLEKRGAAAGKEESPPESPRSNYSSAWETSESDVDGALDLEELQETRPSPTTIFEDNQAKMTEKGGKGGSWLRSVLGTMGKKEGSQEDAGKRTVFGAAHSHFEQPATAAEMLPPVDIEPATSAELQTSLSSPKS